ncbi:alpha/beta hydrolase family protein [Actinocorallia longicatena]|uniref:Xaa-Pro dipeptidyl-peptidase-like domain-containing protein n=1 Tax=Actinocorallia longicatena TaxID=111803 RepID=A0ABP6Q805_9ACTN
MFVESSRKPLFIASLAVSTLAAVAAPVPAHAAPASRTVRVKSFDGVAIVTHFFRAPGLKKGRRQPVIMLGHGWGGRGETDRKAGQLGPLLKAGYNVVTWNARGFGSGGAASVDDPRVEGRDVRKLIDWVARQPEVKLDGRRDPRLGMAGPSYGGAIQLVAAGLDKRVDVIVPMVAFNSVETSLYRDRIFRAGWGLLLCSSGFLQGNKMDSKVRQACATGLASGTLTPDTEQWFREHGPAYLVKRIKIPTLILQGTVDTLFTLREGIANYRTVKGNHAPVKMIWFCGGHGICDDEAGPADRLTDATIAWFGRYLRRDRTVRTGAAFEYIDQHGVYRTAKSYPMRPAGSVRATGSGSLAFSREDINPYIDRKPPAQGKGGLPFPPYVMRAEVAKKAVNIPLKTPGRFAQTVGTPTLTLHYKGTSARPRTALFAQVVDRGTGRVVGNQATPLPVVLDGRDRTVTRTLEALSYTLGPGTDLELQIVPITGLFDW